MKSCCGLRFIYLSLTGGDILKKRILCLMLLFVFSMASITGLSAFAEDNVIEFSATDFAQGDIRKGGGYGIFTAGSWAGYDINIPEEGYYKVTMTFRPLPQDSTNLGSTKVTLSVDEEDGTEFGLRTVNADKTRNVGFLYMTEGDHVLKISASGSRGYRVSDIVVEKAEPHQIAESGEFRIGARSYIASNGQGEDVSGGATSGITNSDGLVEWHSGEEVYYLLEVTKAGNYDLWTVTGQTTSASADITIDNQTERVSVASSGKYFCGAASTKCTFALEEGIYVLKAKQNSSVFYFGLYIERAGSTTITTVTESGEAQIEAEEYNKTTGEIAVGGVVLADGNSAEYNLDIEKSGEYEVTVSYNNATDVDAVLDVMFADRLSASGVLLANGTDFDEYVISGIMLEAGETSLKLAVSDSDAKIDYIKINRLGNIVPTLSDEITLEAEEYIEGTNIEIVQSEDIKALAFSSGSEASYKFHALQSGVYQIMINALNEQIGTFTLLYDDEEIYVKTLGVKSASYDNYIICNIIITEGRHEILVVSEDFEGEINSINIKGYEASDAQNNGEYLSIKDRTDTNLTSDIYENDKSSNLDMPVVGLATVRTGNWVEFSYNAKKEGLYEITVVAGTPQNVSVEISTDGIGALSGNVKNTGKFSFAEATALGVCELSAGNRAIRVTSSDGDIYLYGIIVKPVEAYIEIEAVTAEGVIIANDTVLPKGTSKIDVKFSTDIENTGTVILKSETGDVIPVQLEMDNRMLSVLLTKALEDETIYTLSVSGTKSVYEGILSGEEKVSFKAGGQDFANDTLNAISYALNEGIAEFSYIVKTESGIGIEGRKFKLTVKNPSGAEETVFDGKTSAGGVVNATYNFTQSHQSGKYKFIATSEYTEENPVICELSFITEVREKEILDLLSGTTNDNIEAFFAEYEGEMGIDLEKDLVDISDLDKFFVKFAGVSFESYDDFAEAYNETIIVETINQTTDESMIAELLETEYFFDSVDVSEEKVGIILKNEENQLAERIFDLSEIADNKALIAKVNEIVEDELLKVGKRVDIMLESKDISINHGQSIKIPLNFAEKADDVSSVTIEISSNDTRFDNEYTSVSLEVEGEYKKTYENGVLKVEYTFSNPVDISSLGNISVFPAETKSAYNVKVSGNIFYNAYLDTKYEVEESITLTGKIVEKTFAVSASAVQTGGSSQGNGGSSDRVVSTGGSHGSSAGGNVAVPDVTVPEEKFAFIDIESVSWAQESINALLELGIISKSGDKCYNPNNNITREEFVKLICEALDLTDEMAETTLSDVEKNAWYYKYVASAEKCGVITGSDGKFGVGEKITRQDMAVIIKRAMELKAVRFAKDLGKQFTDDADISEYAKTAVYNLKTMNIINGTGNNLFTPKGNATRAQAAKMIYEMLKVVSA